MCHMGVCEQMCSPVFLSDLRSFDLFLAGSLFYAEEDVMILDKMIRADERRESCDISG